MLRLYRPPKNKDADKVEEVLREMVLAYRVELIEPGLRHGTEAGGTLPALRDGDHLVAGRDAILRHLSALESWVAEWRRFQSDACYLDDDGEVC